MFNDILLSKDTNDEFKASALYKKLDEQEVSLSVETLTNGHWPDQQ